MAAAEATSAGDIRAYINQEYITCDDWTTIEIKQNKLKLIGALTRYTLTKIRFAVASDAVLRVEVNGGPIEFAGGFQGDDTQVGGAELILALRLIKAE